VVRESREEGEDQEVGMPSIFAILAALVTLYPCISQPKSRRRHLQTTAAFSVFRIVACGEKLSHQDS
jgi:hypothetical protein